MMFGRGFSGRGCFGYGYYDNGWLGYLPFIITGLLVIIVLYLLYRGFKKHNTSNAALESLKMKYVQGEITEEEYIKRRDLIK